MLRPDLRTRRRGHFAVRSIGGFVLLLVFIGLRMWARSERRDRQNSGHGANSRPNPDAVANAALEQAAIAFEQGRFPDSINHASAAISSSPNNFDAYVIRSAAYRRSGNLEAALADATKAASLRGSDTEMPMFRASILMEMKRFADAENDFTRTINMSATNAGAYLGRAEARIEQGKLDPAAEDMKKAFTLAPPGWDEMDYAKGVQKKLEAAQAAKAAGNAEAPPGK
ncbi:MAG: hypothetical protein FD180_2514 [Planctomycetota bacterium]|nr:MAG: hypothetical protein FD180_2514 [Planctomycetota bacterium]